MFNNRTEIKFDLREKRKYVFKTANLCLDKITKILPGNMYLCMQVDIFIRGDWSYGS
jgi:hypothetical protein